MASLLLKNVPDALREQLKIRAEGHRRSMNQEALHILEQAMPAAKPLDVRAALAFKPVELEGSVDLTKLLREERDQRSVYPTLPSQGMDAPLAADGSRPAPAKARSRKR